jgi:hypothetical protein
MLDLRFKGKLAQLDTEMYLKWKEDLIIYIMENDADQLLLSDLSLFHSDV